jgi:hypothetical protein
MGRWPSVGSAVASPCRPEFIFPLAELISLVGFPGLTHSLLIYSTGFLPNWSHFYELAGPSLGSYQDGWSTLPHVRFLLELPKTEFVSFKDYICLGYLHL